MSDNLRQGGMSVVDIGIRPEDLDKETPSSFCGKICTVLIKNNIACWFYPNSETTFTLCYPAYCEEKVAELLRPFNIFLDFTDRNRERAEKEAKKKEDERPWWKKLLGINA